jgi:hypothetical protein
MMSSAQIEALLHLVRCPAKAGDPDEERLADGIRSRVGVLVRT